MKRYWRRTNQPITEAVITQLLRSARSQAEESRGVAQAACTLHGASQTVGWLMLLAIALTWVRLPRADRTMLHDLV